MSWQVQKWDSGTSEWVDVDFADIKIKKSLDELNSATIQTAEYVAGDTEMRILYDGNEVFRGIVQRVRTETGGVYNVELKEYAVELRKQLVQVGGQYRVEWINKTANEVIDDILTGSGWTRISSDTTNLGTVTVEYADRLTALSKIVKDMLNKHLWFTADRKVYFGDYNVDRTATVLDYVEKNLEEDVTDVYDGVIVLGAGDGINQKSYQLGSGTRLKVFLAKGAKTDDELQRIAQTLYNAVTTASKRYELETDLHVEINEGDLVSVDGSNYVVYTVEHSLDRTRLSIGGSEPTLSQVLNTKLKGVEEVSYVGQGVTNVSNFGGWETAVDDEHPARYKFYLPDESVGYIKVNEAFINVYGRAYRIWSKGAAAGATGEDANWGVSTIDSIGDTWDTDDISDNTWYKIGGITPSSLPKDVYAIFVNIKFGVHNGDSNGFDCGLTFELRKNGTAIYTTPEYWLTVGAYDYKVGNCAFIVFNPGSKNDTYEVYWKGRYVANQGTADYRIDAYITTASRHDHGTHVHDPQPGIYETSNYPSNVEVWLYNNSYLSGVKVADSTSHPGLAGGNEFSVTKIDVTSYVAPGENTIEVRSDTLGTVQVDGFYRIFIETSR